MQIRNLLIKAYIYIYIYIYVNFQTLECYFRRIYLAVSLAEQLMIFRRVKNGEMKVA